MHLGTDANTADLIVWRVRNNSLFTGRRNAAIKAFEWVKPVLTLLSAIMPSSSYLFDAVDLSIYRLYVKEKQLEGKVTPAWVRKKWENLKQKYKVMTCFHF